MGGNTQTYSATSSNGFKLCLGVDFNRRPPDDELIDSDEDQFDEEFQEAVIEKDGSPMTNEEAKDMSPALPMGSSEEMNEYNLALKALHEELDKIKEENSLIRCDPKHEK